MKTTMDRHGELVLQPLTNSQLYQSEQNEVDEA